MSSFSIYCFAHRDTLQLAKQNDDMMTSRPSVDVIADDIAQTASPFKRSVKQGLTPLQSSSVNNAKAPAVKRKTEAGDVVMEQQQPMSMSSSAFKPYMVASASSSSTASKLVSCLTKSVQNVCVRACLCLYVCPSDFHLFSYFLEQSEVSKT